MFFSLSKIFNIETAITLCCVAAGGNISWQLFQGGAEAAWVCADCGLTAFKRAQLFLLI